MATHADLPGRVAAERAHWLLTQHGLHALMATLSPGSDPADLLERRGSTALADALNNTRPLVDVLLHERLTNLTGPAALSTAATVAATSHPRGWDDAARTIADTLHLPE